MTYDERRALSSPFTRACAYMRAYVCVRRVARDYSEPRNCNYSRGQKKDPKGFSEGSHPSCAGYASSQIRAMFIDEAPPPPRVRPFPYHDGEIRSFVSFATVPNPAACHSKDDNAALDSRSKREKERERGGAGGSRGMIGL